MWSSRPFSVNDGSGSLRAKLTVTNKRISHSKSSILTARHYKNETERANSGTICIVLKSWEIKDQILTQSLKSYVLYLYFGRSIFTGTEIGPSVFFLVFAHSGTHRTFVIRFVDVNDLLIRRVHEIRRHHGSIKTGRSHSKSKGTRSSSVATDLSTAIASLSTMRCSCKSIRNSRLKWDTIWCIPIHVIFWFGCWFSMPWSYGFVKRCVSK